MSLVRYAVDTGHETTMAYAWVRQQGAAAMAVKGYESLAGAIVGQPSGADVSMSGKRLRRGVRVWPVDTSKLKHELYGRLNTDRPEGGNFPNGYVHLPEVDEEVCKQLVAEEIVSRLVRGYRKSQWVKTRERNEELDKWVYARAAAHQVGVDRMNDRDWARMEFALGAGLKRPPIPTVQPEEPKVAPGLPMPRVPPPAGNRGGWLGGRSGGWMRR